AERVHVAADVDGRQPACRLLRRGPGKGAEELAGLRLWCGHLACRPEACTTRTAAGRKRIDLREAEIEDARLAGRVNLDVAGFEIAMDHAAQVCGVDGLTDFQK